MMYLALGAATLAIVSGIVAGVMAIRRQQKQRNLSSPRYAAGGSVRSSVPGTAKFGRARHRASCGALPTSSSDDGFTTGLIVGSMLQGDTSPTPDTFSGDGGDFGGGGASGGWDGPDVSSSSDMSADSGGDVGGGSDGGGASCASASCSNSSCSGGSSD